MKKKLLSIALITMLAATMFTGCGNDENTTSSKDDTSSKVETTVDSESEGTTTDSTESKFDKIDGDKVEAMDYEVIVGELDTSDVDPDKYTVEDIEIPSDNLRVYGASEGFIMDIAVSGTDCYFMMNNETTDAVFNMFVIGADLYSYISMDGEEMYSHATADETSSEMADPGISSDTFTGESVKSITCTGTQTLNDVKYDVIEVVNTEDGFDTTYTLFMDIKSGDVSAMLSDGMIMMIDTIDGITLPKEFATDAVQESNAEDIATQMMAFMFGSLEDTETDVEISTEAKDDTESDTELEHDGLHVEDGSKVALKKNPIPQKAEDTESAAE